MQDSWAPSKSRLRAERELLLTPVEASAKAHLPARTSTECVLGMPHAFCLGAYAAEPHTDIQSTRSPWHRYAHPGRPTTSKCALS